MQSRTKIWQKYYDTCAELEDKVFQTADVLYGII
jgi:hypothetical protein